MTCTSTVPAADAGATAFSSPSPTSWKEAAGTEPKLTAFTRPRFSPVIVTSAPPVDGAPPGETEIRVGGAG
jgi:hypothetical protein